MTPITFMRGYRILPDPLRVEVQALMRGFTVPCVMTLTEMQREFACGTPETFEAEFRRLRPRIEEWLRKSLSSRGD